MVIIGACCRLQGRGAYVNDVLRRARSGGYCLLFDRLASSTTLVRRGCEAPQDTHPVSCAVSNSELERAIEAAARYALSIGEDDVALELAMIRDGIRRRRDRDFDPSTVRKPDLTN